MHIHVFTHIYTHFLHPKRPEQDKGGARRFNLMLGRFPSSGHHLVTKWERLSLAH